MHFHEPGREETPHTFHFDDWLIAGGARLAALAEHVFELLKPSLVTRGKKHRADAEDRQLLCVATLVANLALTILCPARYTGAAVPLENAKLARYDRKTYSADVLRLVIEAAKTAGIITVEGAIFKERRTVVAATPLFTELATKFAVEPSDIVRLVGRETIELWERTADGKHKSRIEFLDSDKTERLRSQMLVINSTLNAADIRFGGRQVEPIHLVRKFSTQHSWGNPDFNRHGRLYNGFWEDLRKDERHFLSIRGKPVADLDFSSMFIRLAYCRQGVEPPPGDLYAVPGLEDCRPGVKRVMVSLFFRHSPARRLPADAKGILPESWTMERFKTAASEFHPAIATLFDTNVGFELMAMESEILVDILLELGSMGIAALPMHDGIMVPQSHKEIAMQTMSTVSAKKAGYLLPVVEKEICNQKPLNSPLWTSRAGL
jgi:hypothetical protein